MRQSHTTGGTKGASQWADKPANIPWTSIPKKKMEFSNTSIRPTKETLQAGV